MLHLRLRSSAGVLALLAALACKNDDGLAAAKTAGKAECERFLDCTLATTPSAVGPLLEAYGPEGSCWDTDSLDAVALCTDACRAGREANGELFPDIKACGECTADEHCANSSGRPYCDGATATCVACNEDSHCDAGVCDPGKHTCAECYADADCDGLLCDPDALTCVSCVEDDQCLAGVCSDAERVCVGCEGDADCMTGTCDAARGVCLDCVTDADCGDLQRCVDAACVIECVAGERRCHADADGRVAVQQCDASGASWQLAESCSASGLACDAGACVVTSYGPCEGPDGTCRKDGDHCVQSGSQFDASYHCEPAAECASASECPAPISPEFAAAVACNDGVCEILCLFGQDCPLGMRCVSGSCGW